MNVQRSTLMTFQRRRRLATKYFTLLTMSDKLDKLSIVLAIAAVIMVGSIVVEMLFLLAGGKL